MGDVVEDHTSIDIRRWRREGLLRPGCRFRWCWFSSGGRAGESIGVEVSAKTVRLSYTVGADTSQARDLSYEVRIARTPCNFGGARLWLTCPARGCGRRVARLYLLGGCFLCRHCQGLGYGEPRPYRLLRRAQGIRKRLGGPTGLSYPFPPRPKGMWRRTYARLRREAEKAEREGHEGTDPRMEALLRRLEKALGR